jgi:nucleotide-binding universal stress UspA family protein
MYHRILIPTDGSRCSQIAVRHGLELAKALGARVTFLYALEDPVSTVYTIPEAVPYQPELYEALRRDAERALQQARQAADTLGVPAESKLAERQDPVRAILDAEAAHDLIVMGTHGRRGVSRLVFGSVAEGVLRQAERPCLLIRDPGKSERGG